MTITDITKDLDKRVRQIVSLASGIEGPRVIPADDGHASPEEPYLTVKQVRYQTLGTKGHSDTYNPENGVFNRAYTQRIQASWDVNCYGKRHNEILRLLTMRMETDEVLEACVARGMAFQRTTQIADLTFLSGKEYVPRGQLEIMFTFSYKYYKDIPAMESAELTFNEVENVEVTIS